MRMKWFVLVIIAIVVLGCGDDGSDTYTVIYAGNGSTSGNVPVDPVVYTSGQEVTVLGNTNGLAQIGHEFMGWTNTAGVTYSNGQTFFISNENVVLYAKWDSNPVANAGTNFSAALGTQVSLDGSASADVDGTLTYAWEAVVGNPAAVTLINATSVNPTFTAPTSLGDYTFKLTVSDGVTNSSSTVTVTIGLASSIYVNLSTGDDSNLGVLKAVPKKTILSAFDNLAENGTIYVSGDYTFTSGNSTYDAGLYVNNKVNFNLSGGWDSSFTTQGSPSVLHGNDDRNHVVIFYRCTNFSMANFQIRNGCGDNNVNGWGSGTGLWVWNCGKVRLDLDVCYNTNTVSYGAISVSGTDVTVRGNIHHNQALYAMGIYAHQPNAFTNYANVYDNFGSNPAWGSNGNSDGAITLNSPVSAYISGAIYNNYSEYGWTGGIKCGNNTIIAGDCVITNNAGANGWYNTDKGFAVYNSQSSDGTCILQTGAIYSPNICSNRSTHLLVPVTGSDNLKGVTIQ